MKNGKLRRTLFFTLSFLSSMALTISAAEIEETVLGMNVSGNKEAPNILYIIPWKDASDKVPPPEVTRLMDEVYSTVDPDVYQKEVFFYEQLTADTVVNNKK